MNFLDMKTVIFSNVVTNIVCMLVILMLWHQSRNRFAGTGFWVIDFAFQTAALFLVILRGSIPDWMSMVLANTLVIAGALLGYMGLGRFVGKKISQVHNYVLVAAFACIHTYFALVEPNLAARSLNLSVGLLLICFQCMWLLLPGVEPGMRRLTLGVGMVFGAYCLVSLVRIVEFFIGRHLEIGYFQSGPFEPFVLVSYKILFILLTFALALMFNKRLLAEVKTQEEKFAKAFHSSPYAITLTRLFDGKIIEVNDGFLNITGYQHAEIMGKTTVGLHLWDKEEDRVVAVNELSKSGKVQGREFQFRKKSGKLITGLFSAEIIWIDNQGFVLSSISDITERKRAENELARLNQQNELILCSAAEGILGLDLQGNYTFVNPAAARMLGWGPEELIGRDSHSTWHHTKPDGSPYPREECAIYAAYRDGAVHRASTEVFWRKDGTSFPVGYASTPIYEQGRLAGAVVTFADVTERKRVEAEREKLIRELQEALVRVKQLSGLLPICASCKKVREDNGYWTQIEAYVRDHSEADFSHGICPDCARRLYPDLNPYDEDERSEPRT
jgi:PAS domain S-box-containing protein